MAFLNAVFQSEFFMTQFWRWLILDVFSFIANYGWRIVLFTVLLKLLLSPLDFFNRKKSMDNARKMKKMKPEMDRLDKQYANDQQTLMLKKRALQKKYKYGMGMTCLTSIITLFVFLTLWNSMTAVSRQMNVEMYDNLHDVYSSRTTELNALTDYTIVETEHENYLNFYVHLKANDLRAVKENKEKTDEELREQILAEYQQVNGYTFNADADYSTKANDADVKRQYSDMVRYMAQQSVATHYETNEKEALSWAWVKNIWRPDTWQNPIPTVNEYQSSTGSSTIDETEYNNIMLAVKNEYTGTWNGLLILVVLTVVLNFLNQFIAMRIQKSSGEQQMAGSMGGTMKIMMFIMPLMLAFFAFQYASAFTLYMVTNAAMTLLLTGVSTGILKMRERKILAQEENGYRIRPAQQKKGKK